METKKQEDLIIQAMRERILRLALIPRRRKSPQSFLILYLVKYNLFVTREGNVYSRGHFTPRPKWWW